MLLGIAEVPVPCFFACILRANTVSEYRSEWILLEYYSRRRKKPVDRGLYPSNELPRAADPSEPMEGTSQTFSTLLPCSSLRKFIATQTTYWNSLVLSPDCQSEHAISGPRCAPREFPLCLNE